MPLLKNNAFVEDDWVHLADDQPVGSLTKVTVTAERLVRDWDELVRLPGLLGIHLSNTTREFDLNPYLPQLALIVLPFPAFKTRAFTATSAIDADTAFPSRSVRVTSRQASVRTIASSDFGGAVSARALPVPLGRPLGLPERPLANCPDTGGRP